LIAKYASSNKQAKIYFKKNGALELLTLENSLLPAFLLVNAFVSEAADWSLLSKLLSLFMEFVSSTP